MMIDSEIYVDRIVSGKLHDLNVMLEALRQTKLLEDVDPEDIVMQTLKVAQISDDDFFGTAISKDLMEILSSIREAHVTDPTTADAPGADMVREALDLADRISKVHTKRRWLQRTLRIYRSTTTLLPTKNL